MAYRLPRPGVLEVQTEGRHIALVGFAVFVAVTAGVLAWLIVTSGGLMAMLAPIAVVGLLSGAERLVLLLREHDDYI